MDRKVFSVLLVEDIAHARNLLIKYIGTRPELQLSGIAKDGQKALEKLLANTYDLLFLDVNLPVISGVEILEHLDSIKKILLLLH